MTAIDLVESAILELHPDRDLAALLVPKLYIGAKRFVEHYEQTSGVKIKEVDS